MKKNIVFAFVMLLSAITGARADSGVKPFTHPAMLHTQKDIDMVVAKKGDAVISSALKHLESSAYAQTSYKEQTARLKDGYLKRMDYGNWGPDGKIGQYDDYSNYTAAMRDANAAYQLALRYVLTGNTEAADAAVKVLNAWAGNCKGVLRMEGYANNIPDPNIYLIMIQGHQFANAAELLRGYQGWEAADFSAFQDWMRTTFADISLLFLKNHHNNVGNKHYWLNWDLATLTAVLSVGILCDDHDLTDYAIRYFKDMDSKEVGGVRNAIPFLHVDGESGEILGQCQESGRDQGHATLCVALLGTFCQMAENIGEDLFAYDDFRPLAMAEYVAKYNLMRSESFGKASLSTEDFLYNDMPFTEYIGGKNNEYHHTALSETARGTLRPCWEIFASYARRAGRSAVYCTQWAEMMREKTGYGDGGAGDYGPNSGGHDQLGYGTLMFLFAPSRSESPSTDIAALTTEHGDSANIYNLCGQRLSAAAKGVNIMRGKKYLVR